jgi:preprotein translocase subunit SecE
MATSVRPRTGGRRSEPTPLQFLREALEELRKVSWPTWAELYRYTLVVIVTVAVLAAFIGALDWGLQKLTAKFIYDSVVNS